MPPLAERADRTGTVDDDMLETGDENPMSGSSPIPARTSCRGDPDLRPYPREVARDRMEARLLAGNLSASRRNKMRTKRVLFGSALTTMLAVATMSVPASAASPTATYAGDFGGTIRYEGCTTQAPTATTTGTWSVTLHGKSAKAVFDIDVNSQPHVAYTFPGMKQLSVEQPTVFSVTGKTQAGQLTVTLSGSDLTYTIAPYNYDGLSCESVTYPGSL
jgi:hypothetical protein